jgi:hypothetical protein
LDLIMARTGSIGRAVAAALKDAQLLPQDAAAVALVRRYAATLDSYPDTLEDLGPKLLAALTALGMTPAGRGVKGGGSGAGPVASKLDELRARRAQRAG